MRHFDKRVLIGRDTSGNWNGWRFSDHKALKEGIGMVW
jgi:hypothetical protein